MAIKARVAPILYMEGACGVRLGGRQRQRDLQTWPCLHFPGLHRGARDHQHLFGTDAHLFDSEVLRQKAIAIITRLKAATDEWKEETELASASTPLEREPLPFLPHRCQEFGVAGVTDKGYYTNSFHLDVEKKVDPYAKLDFERAYPPLASGGFICYGEYPKHAAQSGSPGRCLGLQLRQSSLLRHQHPDRRMLRVWFYRRVRLYQQGLHLPQMW